MALAQLQHHGFDACVVYDMAGKMMPTNVAMKEVDKSPVAEGEEHIQRR